MTNKNKNKKLNRKDRAAIEREELKAKLLEKYVEGESNIDYDQLSSDEIWKVIYPFPLSPEKKEKGKNLERIKERRKILGRKFPLIAKKEWIEREIAKIESKKPKVTAHKVQDPNAKYAKYRLKFVEAAKEFHPQMLADLKVLAPNFKNLFANKSNKEYFTVFDELKYNLIKCWRISPEHYTSDIYTIDNSYIWGIFERAFRLSNIKRMFSNSEILSRFKDDTPQIIEKNKHVLDGFSNTVTDAFQKTAADKDLILPDFYTLQSKIYEWVEKYHFHKDWLVDYAHYFIYQFSQNPELEPEDVVVGIKNYDYSRTMYLPFKFEANGWWAAEDGETANQYKARVSKEFETQLNQYIIEANASMRLNELPKFTKHPAYTSVKWLVYSTVNGWDSERITEKFYEDISADRTKSNLAAKAFESKKKHIENEIRKLKAYDLPMRNNL